MGTGAALPQEFSVAAVAHLDRALQAYLASPDDAGHEILRVALERICSEAHTVRLGPERMLVAVKAVWARVPDIDRLDVERSRVLLASVVGHCIEAYYRSAQSSRSAFRDERLQPRVS